MLMPKRVKHRKQLDVYKRQDLKPSQDDWHV